MKNKTATKKGRPRKKPVGFSDVKKKYGTAISDYDFSETTDFIDETKPLKLEDIGFTLPEIPVTQVVSLRIPTYLLNEIKAISSQNDIPYQALIKLFLKESVEKAKKKPA